MGIIFKFSSALTIFNTSSPLTKCFDEIEVILETLLLGWVRGTQFYIGLSRRSHNFNKDSIASGTKNRMQPFGS